MIIFIRQQISEKKIVFALNCLKLFIYQHFNQTIASSARGLRLPVRGYFLSEKYFMNCERSYNEWFSPVEKLNFPRNSEMDS